MPCHLYAPFTTRATVDAFCTIPCTARKRRKKPPAKTCAVQCKTFFTQNHADATHLVKHSLHHFFAPLFYPPHPATCATATNQQTNRKKRTPQRQCKPPPAVHTFFMRHRSNAVPAVTPHRTQAQRQRATRKTATVPASPAPAVKKIIRF